MNYLSVVQIAKKWGLSERSVRNYCAQGRINGAFLTGKTWNIPENAIKPSRIKNTKFSNNPLLNTLKEQKDMNLKGGIYHKTQVSFAYNSNHIEGSKLSEDQTRFIFETNTIGISNDVINIDDIIETVNHFKCVDFIIEHAKDLLSENLIKEIHFILKTGTKGSQKDWFNIGKYKKLPNQVGGEETCPPENVSVEMKKLLEKYSKIENKSIENIIEFHYQFEKIHPFQDGNGRVGRLIMFKECLTNDIVPFIIEDNIKYYYYRGIKEWESECGYLIETCLSAQDQYKVWLDYFKIDIK